MKTKKKGLHAKWNTFFPNPSEDQTKKVVTKNGTLFPRIQVDTCAQMHTRIKLLGGMYPPHPPSPPRVSAPLTLIMFLHYLCLCHLT